MLAGSVLVMLVSQAPAPQSAVWTLFIKETPTAVVRADLTPGRFVWSVETPFDRNGRREVVVKVDANGKDPQGRVPEALWFFKKPAPGCVDGFDESSGREGKLCLEYEGRGTSLDQKFEAEWGADGVLESLLIRGVKWRRGQTAWSDTNPWLAGFLVKGSKEGRPTLQPRIKHSVQQTDPRPTGKRSGKGDCLSLARAVVDGNPKKYELVLGLVIEGDRAWPHAWVRRQSDREEEDPSVPLGQSVDRVYISIPAVNAPQAYLDLASGRLSVVRE